MRSVVVVSGAILVVVLATGASAANLSCEQFKQRLNAKLAGTSVGQISDYRQAPDEDNKLVQYKFGGSLGVDGLLTCDKAGDFGSFEFGLKPSGGFGQNVSLKFSTLASASVCALTSSDDATCAATVARIVGGGLRKYSGDDASSDYHLFAPDPMVAGEFDIGEGEYDWTVGPGHYHTMSDALKPLNPENVDSVN